MRLTCGVLGFSAHAFYAWRKKLVSSRDLEDTYVINALINARGDDQVFSFGKGHYERDVTRPASLLLRRLRWLSFEG